jgi:cyclophilin family peptidyl-prolyl cis-trans isomerase
MKIFGVLIAVLLGVLISCKPTKYTDLDEGLYADLSTNKGAILLKLEFKKTPITVANFVSLAEGSNEYVTDSIKGKPYYNGLIFHRVLKDFMIQTGDPLGTGSGNPGYQFIDEFPKDESGNLLLKHDRPGILSMANAGPATNGSQFFITHKETAWLDGKHTVFGQVVRGQSVVDLIVQSDKILTVKIIKVGREAKSFKASKEFSNFYENYSKDKIEKELEFEETVKNTLDRFNNLSKEAIEYPSGLKMIISETKNGKKPKNGNSVRVHYAGYFSNGELFDTSIKEVAIANQKYSKSKDDQERYEAFSVTYGPEAELIPGFKEGLQKMKIGDKAVLFIPSHLAYGSQGAGGVIPPNTNLVFELELVGFEKDF